LSGEAFYHIFFFVRLWPQNEHSIHTGQSSKDHEASAKWPHTTSFNQPTILYIWFFICFASRVSLSSLQLQLECRSHTVMWTWAWRSRSPQLLNSGQVNVNY
jgi:hypothetical protein